MTVEWYVLVCVGGFAIDIKVNGTIWITDDFYVQHGNAAILFHFFGPFYGRVDGVEVGVESVDVVVADGCDGVVGFPVLPVLPVLLYSLLLSLFLSLFVSFSITCLDSPPLHPIYPL